jgi:hypothetical protein
MTHQPASRRSLIILAAALVVALAALLIASRAEGATANVGAVFQTPSGNIICLTGNGEFEPKTFWCLAIQTAAKRCVYGVAVGWPNGGSTIPSRRAMVRCSAAGERSDAIQQMTTGPLAHRRLTLAYGAKRSISGTGVTCQSLPDGLSCMNRGGHGFFLSRTVIKTK